MKRSKLLMALIIAGMAGLYLAIGVVQFRQHDSLKRVMLKSDREALWTFFQLESEYLRFSNALNQRVLSSQSITMEQLQLRYDIFVSRTSALDRTEDTSSIAAERPIAGAGDSASAAPPGSARPADCWRHR